MDSESHYKQSNIEPIEVIESWNLDFNLGNVIKYVGRARYKGDELGDLKKALWYLNRHISRRKGYESEDS